MTNQLANPEDQHGRAELPPPPQVVFVSSETCSEDTQVDCLLGTQTGDGEPEVAVATEIDGTTELATFTESLPDPLLPDPIVALAENELQGDADEELDQSIVAEMQALHVENLQELSASHDSLPGKWQHRWFCSAEPRFLLDPFDQAVDGPVPVLPSLPIVKAIEMTENVVSREQKGMHYAWRLKPGPYPDLGNMPQFSNRTRENVPESVSEIDVTEVTEVVNDAAVAETDEPRSNELDDTAWVPDLENWSPQEGPWTQSETVAEGDVQQGDDFYAQPGDVISIDGNKGYDHIDLSSYALEDATFQPGAILLNPKVDNDAGEPEPPIIIRHRGIGFAIFDGDVNVEL